MLGAKHTKTESKYQYHVHPYGLFSGLHTTKAMEVHHA